MQIITMPVPAQDGITRDNVTVRVDAVIYFKVADPVRAAVDVQDYRSAIGQVAQTSLRSIIGKSNLDDLLSNREGLNQGLELMIDSPALGWGIHIDRVEIKDVVLPDSMKRSIARQAEAERERRARVITADGELQASEKLAQAAGVMAKSPTSLEFRLLKPSSRWPRRRTPPWSFRSPSNCSGSWRRAPTASGLPAGPPSHGDGDDGTVQRNALVLNVFPAQLEVASGHFLAAVMDFGGPVRSHPPQLRPVVVVVVDDQADGWVDFYVGHPA